MMNIVSLSFKFFLNYHTFFKSIKRLKIEILLLSHYLTLNFSSFLL